MAETQQKLPVRLRIFEKFPCVLQPLFEKFPYVVCHSLILFQYTALETTNQSVIMIIILKNMHTYIKLLF